MKQQLKIIGLGIAACLGISLVAALFNSGVRENRNLPALTTPNLTPTLAPPQTSQEPTATYDTPVIDPTYPPTIPPTPLKLIIPTVVSTIEPTQVPVVATPRSLTTTPLFDAKLVIGQPIRSVERLLGKPTDIDTGGMDKGWQLRSYEVAQYIVDITFNDRGRATEAFIVCI